MTPLDLATQAYQKKLESITAVEQAKPEPTLVEKVDIVVKEEMGDQIAPVKSINDCVYIEPGGEDEIIGDRYLCRGSGLLFPAPTGIGKSTFVIQTFCHAALGREAYGLRFTRPTKALYVQAENDDSDLAGMRDGVYEACGFNAKEIKEIGENLLVLTESNRTGIHLINYLRDVIREYRPHLLILDPLFSYLGGNASEQAMVSTFLRNMLNPLMIEENIAAWLVHHTNKPPTGAEKRQWSGTDLSYLGAGSAEFSNWARSTLAIRQLGLQEEIYELRAQKRGKRLKWTDPQGSPVVHRYIAHAEGSIHWQDADWDYVQELLGGGNEEKKPTGRPRKEINPEDIKTLDGYPFMSKAGAVEALAGLAKCSPRKAIDLVDLHLVKSGEGRDATWILG